MRHSLSAAFASVLLAAGHASASSAATEGASASATPIPTQLFAGEQRGPYRTSTFQTYWIDESRDEPLTLDPNDKVRLTVQLWYPAELRGSGKLAPYVLTPEQFLIEIPAAERDPNAEGAQMEWANAVRHVVTTSLRDAPAVAGKRFPVLIYSPGSGYPQFVATFQSEFLASHGYVVVAISHPGHNGVERQPYPDGYVYQARFDRTPEDLQEEREHAALAQRERIERTMSGLLADGQRRTGGLAADVRRMVRNVSFALDRLTIMNDDPRQRLYGRLDLQQVGAYGWSLGGAASLQASLDEPRVKAAINGDGWPYGLTADDGVVKRGSPRPVMMMSGRRPDVEQFQGPEDAAGRELGQLADLYYWEMFRRSSDEWYWLHIAHANHGSFCDLPLWDRDDDPQALDPRLAHQIINRYTLEFFDKHLRGRVDTPLLAGSKQYRDASLMRKATPAESDH